MTPPDFLIPSPLHLLKDPVLEKSGIEFYLKRDDLIHAEISGNKWRKLKYNLIKAEELGFKKLLTFGGAYSNHIYATAAAGHYFGFDTLGIIRGNELDSRANPTLRFASEMGMEFIFTERNDYRSKEWFYEKFSQEYYIIPEGGSNSFAIPGTAEITDEIYSELIPDYIACAVGTGGTLAGIISKCHAQTRVIGFSALKNGSFLQDDILQLTGNQTISCSWEIETENYHFGGYAKTKPALTEFIKAFEIRNPGVKLDQVYTGKMMFGLYDMIQKNSIKSGTKIVVIHTGGLQGRSPLLDQ